MNLARSVGVGARRLLLLDSTRQSKHVLAEVYLGERWVVVDPSYHFIFRDASGQMLTRQQLLDPRKLREATQKLPNYPANYTFERTANVRLARIPRVGVLLRSALTAIWPAWEENIAWTLLLERESLLFTIAAALVLCALLAMRGVLSWYGDRRLGVQRIRLREQLARAGVALFSNPR